MDGENKTIPLMGPSGLYHAEPNEAQILLDSGFRPATPEDIEFSSPTQKFIGAAEVVGRGVVPFFTAAELLAGAEPDRIRKRKEISVGEGYANAGEVATMILGPGIVGKGLGLLGKVAGVPKALEMAAAASKFGTKAGIAETLGNAVSDGIEGQIGKLASKFAIEGAAFGVMDSLDRSLISPEPKDALSVAADALSAGGMGLITGAAGGAVVGKARELWQARFGNKAARVLEQIKAETGTPPVPPPGAPTPPSGPGAVSAAAPTSLDDMKLMAQRIAQAPVEEGPEKASLLDAISKIKDDSDAVLPTELHIQSYDNPVVRDKFRIAKEMADENAGILLNYDQMIKKSMVNGIDKEIRKLNPNPIVDKMKSGRRVLELFSNEYLGEKAGKAEFFKRFDNAGMNPITYLGEITGRLEQAIPGIEKSLMYDGVDGTIKIKPWEITDPFTKETHSAAKNVLTAINKKDLTIGQLRNARKNLKSYIDWSNNAQAKTNMEVSGLRKSLMDIVENEIQKIDNSLDVRQAFKEYAINEQNREEIERILRGKLFGVGKTGREIPPEDVMQRLFSDTTAIKSAKQILGEEKFNSVLGDYLAQRVNEFTDPARKTFSSARMNTFLSARQKLPELETAFENNLETLERIKAYNTIARIVPDAQSIQPSGNVKTVLGAFRDVINLKNISENGLINTITAAAANRVEKEETKAFLNQILKGEGKQAKAFYKFLDSPAKVSASAFESMREYIKYATRGHYLVIRAAKSVLDDKTKMPVQEKTPRELDSFDKHLQKMENDPESLLNVGGEIPYYMPEQAGIMGLNTARVINYLKTKRPGVYQNSPLDTPRRVSNAEKQSYLRTLQIAANPPVVFKYMKEGRLLSKDVQDLQSMYPDVYDKYVMQALDSLTEHLASGKPIPLRVKKSLSLFGAMPLDSSLKPEAIQAAQSTYQPKNQPAPTQPQFAAKSSRKSQVPELTETDQQRRMRKD